MLIRVSGYNSGVKEYLEEGVKNGRDYSREELDERLILYGDLDLTEMTYRSIPDKGQNRYTTFTLSFKEDEVSEETLKDITKEFREFIMYAYDDVEYNFYAEAHIPKLKTVFDKRTGEKIERKPHIHIVVPKINLLSGNVTDVIGDPEFTEKYLEAFQEYINKKYNMASPREHVRVNPYNASDVLSRYKGDDFRGKNREFKQELVKEIINNDIRTREGFYTHVASFGETKVVNQGKENEYIKVRLSGDAKFTTLKETVFNDAFIRERKLSRPPLPEHVIAERLQEWPMRSKEIKYIAKASSKSRHEYYRESGFEQKLALLSEQQHNFYSQYGGSNELHPSQRERSHERSAPEDSEGRHAGTSDGMQGVPGGVVAADGKNGVTTGAVFLPGNARVHLAQPGRDPGLRPGVSVRRPGRTEAGREGPEAGREDGAPAEAGGEGRRSGAAPQGPGSAEAEERGESHPREGRAGGKATYQEAGEIAGGRRESGETASAGGEETAERDSVLTGNDPDSAGNFRGTYPSDPGTRESQRYAGIPGLGQSDAAIRIRGGFGTGRLEPGLPVYARNGLRVPDVGAIERNTQRLFSNSVKTPAPRQGNVRLIRRVMPRAPRNASWLAASLQRQQEQSTLTSAQRRALYQADRQFFDTRRLIQSDGRLSVKDKTQLLAVLTFERLKAHQQIIRPQWPNQQESTMGSEDIRKNIRPERKWRNSISGPEDNPLEPKGAKERFSKMSQQVAESMGERSIREKVRIITAADLYTRKSRLSENIHYLDKSTDKTLFIDTGKAIAVSKNGLSESGVAVALELAKEKFGSTLNVKGTKAFKDTAIEVVAQKGLDIHFTDKDMNRRLAERKAELAIEREGQSISSAESDLPVTADDHKKAFAALASEFRQLLDKAPRLDAAALLKETQALSRENVAMSDNWMNSDVYTPEAGLENSCDELEKSLHEVYGQKLNAEKVTTWFTERESNKPDFPVRTLDFEAAYDGIIEAYQYMEENMDALPATELSRQFNNLRLERVELSQAYHSPNHATKITGLESSLKSVIDARLKAEPVVRQKASEEHQPAPEKAPEQQQARKAVSHTGILIEHGAAPYKFEPDLSKPENERDDSYFVKLQMPDGKDKVVWGVTLARAVENLLPGEQVRLTNQGKETVQWTQQLANGQTETRQGERVNWQGVSLDRHVDNDIPEQYQEWETTESEGPSVA